MIIFFLMFVLSY